MKHYLYNPSAIYRESFAHIQVAVDLDAVPKDLQVVVARLAHTCGASNIVSDLAWSQTIISSVVTALRKGAPILVDVETVAQGVRYTPLLCMLNDPRVPCLALTHNITRSASAVTLWKQWLQGAVVVIGNAPTALLQLLEYLVRDNALYPAAILAFPVGFINASESKEALIHCACSVPYLTLKGQRGGSALATAAINALLEVGLAFTPRVNLK